MVLVWVHLVVIQSGSVHSRFLSLAVNWFLEFYLWLVHRGIGVWLPLLHLRQCCGNKCCLGEEHDKEELFLMDELFLENIYFTKIYVFLLFYGNI